MPKLDSLVYSFEVHPFLFVVFSVFMILSFLYEQFVVLLLFPDFL